MTRSVQRAFGAALLGLACAGPAVGQATAAPEARDMRLVDSHDLQARSAYQPTIHRQGDRWILYVGHHGGTRAEPKPLNPLTGEREFNGTSVLDVTDPANPVHIRDFGLPGQQDPEGQTAAAQHGEHGSIPAELHGGISTGPAGNRIYFGYGTNSGGMMQIVDREKLLNGPKEPTDDNLRAPEVSRLVMMP